MVYYFTSEHDGKRYTLYVGRDKMENEELIRFGFPHDVWFHVDGLSSAHIYLRMEEGWSLKDIPEKVLTDCAQLTKANSIEGNKKTTGAVRIVYTKWTNLKKTKGMEDGAVDFHNRQNCSYVTVLQRENAIINRLDKTRVEKPTTFIRESREAYEAELRAREKIAKKAHQEKIKQEKLQHAKAKEERSYDSLFKPDEMISNAEIGASSSNAEDDFM